MLPPPWRALVVHLPGERGRVIYQHLVTRQLPADHVDLASLGLRDGRTGRTRERQRRQPLPLVSRRIVQKRVGRRGAIDPVAREAAECDKRVAERAVRVEQGSGHQVMPTFGHGGDGLPLLGLGVVSLDCFADIPIAAHRVYLAVGESNHRDLCPEWLRHQLPLLPPPLRHSTGRQSHRSVITRPAQPPPARVTRRLTERDVWLLGVEDAELQEHRKQEHTCPH
mmetsp:Transcript_13249/g.38234  ORF Transcript_13249/g.38234 Transcript_13249/m.38234 type:complete len:224 (+) Transcript_13249:872-1543(+)